MTELERKLWMCLMGITHNADEDCPQHHRTTHFNDALSDAYELLAEMNLIASKLPT